jgi:hypothetical protein
MRPTLESEMPISRAILLRDQCVAPSGVGLRRPGNYIGDPVGLNRRGPPGARSILHQSGDAQFKKPASPKRCHTRRHPKLRGNLLVLHPLCG